VGRETAHVAGTRWVASCEVGNGLALHILHHRLIDLGVLTLTGDLRVQFNRVVGEQSAWALL